MHTGSCRGLGDGILKSRFDLISRRRDSSRECTKLVRLHLLQVMLVGTVCLGVTLLRPGVAVVVVVGRWEERLAQHRVEGREEGEEDVAKELDRDGEGEEAGGLVKHLNVARGPLHQHLGWGLGFRELRVLRSRVGKQVSSVFSVAGASSLPREHP